MIEKELQNLIFVGRLDDDIVAKYGIYHLEPTEEDIAEMIEKVDFNTFKSVISKFCCVNSHCVNDEALEKILRRWAIKKFPFYVMFGRHLSVTYEVDFETDNDSVNKRINELFSHNIVKRNNKNNDVVDVSRFNLYKPIVTLFNERDITSNICTEKVYLKTMYKRYKEGLKLSRFFSSFFKDKDFDIEYSKVIQQKANKEGVVLSIHPIDYLTCSWNGNSWSTCYSPGNIHCNAVLEMIYDESTINAFITHSNFQISNNISWNSKILRSFVNISKYNCSFSIGRCYPNVNNEQFYKAVKSAMMKLLEEYFKLDKKHVIYTVTITEYMDGSSCHDTYKLVNNKRIHVNVNKRVLKTESDNLFLDPVKYFCTFTDRVIPILCGDIKHICIICGNPVFKFEHRRFLCDDCINKM